MNTRRPPRVFQRVQLFTRRLEPAMYVPGKKEAWLAIVTLIVLAVLLATGSL